MKSRPGNLLLLLFFLAAALVLAALLAQVTAGVPALKWITYGESIGVDDLRLNLAVLDVGFSFHLNVNVVQIVLLATALVVYRRVAR